MITFCHFNKSDKLGGLKEYTTCVATDKSLQGTASQAAEKAVYCHSEARFSPKNLSVDWT
jgi:hypothetical protein